MPRRFDLQTFFFRFNLVLTGIVFFLMSPTLRVYQSWFPEKKDSLWLYPVAGCVISGLLWLAIRLNIPKLIDMGFMKELRVQPRDNVKRDEAFYWKMAGPILLTLFHVLAVVFIAASIIAFLKREPFMELFNNIPETKRFAR